MAKKITSAAARRAKERSLARLTPQPIPPGYILWEPSDDDMLEDITNTCFVKGLRDLDGDRTGFFEDED